MSMNWMNGCNKCSFLIVYKRPCWERAKYSGICSVRFLFFLWEVKRCTFSHFSRPFIIYLQIRIEGTLVDLLEWVECACLALFCAHIQRNTPPLHHLQPRHTLKCYSLNRTNIDTIINAVHSLQSGISPGPLVHRAPWQKRGSFRVSTTGTGNVAGQSSAA